MFDKIKSLYVKARQRAKKALSIYRNRNMSTNWYRNKINKYDGEIYQELEACVNESRLLEFNSPIYSKYLNMCSNNIVGPDGFKLTVMSETLRKGKFTHNTRLNQAIELSFKKWSNRKYCDITNKNSFNELKRIMIKTLKRDGEILIRKVRNSSNNNPFGFSLQLLDPLRLDINFGKSLPENLENGNYVIMGVEFNSFHQAVAYHLRTEDNGKINNTYSSYSRERVKADEIIHRFKSLSQEQSRGLPQAHSVFSKIMNLEDILETTLQASKINASTSLFFQTKEGYTTGAESIATRKREDNLLEIDLSPGGLNFLPPGVEMTSFDGKYPEQAFISYVTFLLKMIASGMNVSYFILTSSLNEINFSSSRVGLDEEREHWKTEQDWFIDNVLNDIFEDWLKTSLLNSALFYEDGKQVTHNVLNSILDNYEFKGRRWDAIDKEKDSKFIEFQLRNNLTTITDELNKLGRSFEDICIKKQREQEILKQYNFNIKDNETNTMLTEDIDEKWSSEYKL